MNEKKNSPACVGIIIDGNRRWAKKHGYPTHEGHNAGYRKLKESMEWAKDAGITTVIAYAFSTENWNRTEQEVSLLMKLLRRVVETEGAWAIKNGIRVRCIGDRERLPGDIQKGIKDIEYKTREENVITLVFAISYGGRDEITRAVRNAAALPKETLMHIKEDQFAQFLDTKDIPDPDLIVRTGGEIRLSNFLPWQSVYSELFFTDVYWPDFSKDDFTAILDEYAKRDRRKGK